MNSQEKVQVWLATFPEMAAAERIANVLVDERLAACVNLFPEVHSVYRWKGEVQSEREVAAWIKSVAGCGEALMARFLELHPYDTPALVALDLDSGSPAFMEWVRQSCAGASHSAGGRA